MVTIYPCHIILHALNTLFNIYNARYRRTRMRSKVCVPCFVTNLEVIPMYCRRQNVILTLVMGSYIIIPYVMMAPGCIFIFPKISLANFASHFLRLRIESCDRQPRLVFLFVLFCFFFFADFSPRHFPF